MSRQRTALDGERVVLNIGVVGGHIEGDGCVLISAEAVSCGDRIIVDRRNVDGSGGLVDHLGDDIEAREVAIKALNLNQVLTCGHLCDQLRAKAIAIIIARDKLIELIIKEPHDRVTCADGVDEERCVVRHLDHIIRRVSACGAP